MPPGDDGADLAAGYIARWRPSSVSPPAAAFARQVVRAACPGGRERAKNLLWAAARLAGYAVPLGLDPVPEVLLQPSVIERFTRCAPGLSGVARRTLRTNLRFLARQVVPQLAPADAPLPREHAKAPCSPAEIAGYLALADAQPTLSRRMRASGLVCLGAGAGLIRADLRAVHGIDVTCRSGGVIVTVRGARPRVVPVLARHQDRLLAAAAFAGTGLICGGTDPGRRNITTPLIRSLAGGAGLPRLDTSRLRATWLADVADLPVRPPRSWQRPGSPAPSGSATCSPAWNPPESRTRSGCSGRPGRHDPAARPGGDHRPLGRRAADRGATAHRGAPPAAADPHLAGGHADRAGRSPARPPHPRAPGPDHAARGRPAPARRGRGLETRPAPADLPPDRADLRPRRGRARQGRPRRPAVRYPHRDLQRPAGSQHPRRAQARQRRAGGGLDRRGDLLPPAVPRHQRLRRPRGLLGPPLRRRPWPGQRAVLRLLRLGRHHDARGARPPGSRSWPGG